MARPTKLTPELKGQLLALLRASVPLATAAPIVGICRKTLANWLERAATEEEGEFHELGLDIEQAKAQARIPFISAVAKSGRTNTKDAKWMLERGDPERWERSKAIRTETEVPTAEETARQIRECLAAIDASLLADPPPADQDTLPAASPEPDDEAA
jgi:hypothetical protein